MGKSWKDDGWHDADEMWEEERRRKDRRKRVVEEPAAEQEFVHIIVPYTPGGRAR